MDRWVCGWMECSPLVEVLLSETFSFEVLSSSSFSSVVFNTSTS